MTLVMLITESNLVQLNLFTISLILKLVSWIFTETQSLAPFEQIPFLRGRNPKQDQVKTT